MCRGSRTTSMTGCIHRNGRTRRPARLPRPRPGWWGRTIRRRGASPAPPGPVTGQLHAGPRLRGLGDSDPDAPDVVGEVEVLAGPVGELEGHALGGGVAGQSVVQVLVVELLVDVVLERGE